MNSLLATIDLMGVHSFSRRDLAEGARELFVKAVVAAECYDLEVTDEQLNGLAACTTLERISGSAAEELYIRSAIHILMQTGCDADSAREVVCPEHIDWRYISAPRTWIIRVARAVGEYWVLVDRQMKEVAK